MSVFISYSSIDCEFVKKLSLLLVEKKINIWLDKWEMKPGDSLIDKIQSGISNSSYLLVVLSKNSIQSEWCKKELNSGLIRELEEKKVVIIPILLEDCEVPIFLREKVYADFRKDFEDGISTLLPSLQKLFSEHMGRVNAGNNITDFAINWGLDKINDQFLMEIDCVTWNHAQKKTLLLQIKIEGDSNATNRFTRQYVDGYPEIMKETLLLSLKSTPATRDLRVLIQNDKVDPYLFTFKDEKLNLSFNVVIRGVLMGEDNNNDIIVSLTDYLEMIDSLKKK